MAVSERLVPLRVLPSTPPASARVVTTIHRPYFLMGILSVLTAGCLLGAIALLGIARQGSYLASAWTPYVLAHANSQLYGWVGFFVMGFSLQFHAPRRERARLFHQLAYLSLGLMAAAIAMRFFAEPLVAANRAVWLPVGIASGVLQVVSLGLFVANTAITRYSTGGGLTWPTKFVFASLGWWALVALAEPVYFATSHQADRMASVGFVAEWFAPYREAQFLGFVTNMIFGVALVKLHSCFGVREADRLGGNAGFFVWNIGLAVRMVGWVVYFHSGMESPLLYTLGGILLASGAALLVRSLRIFELLETRMSAHKFVRAAMGWLLIAGLLLLLEPLHLRAIGAPFSHAFTGAVRHAITVGFISQMILGFGLHVVNRHADVPDALVKALWPTFMLLNLGNTARVLLEIGTDYSSAAFAPMGITGFIELTGLVIWGAYLARTMLRARSSA